MTGSVGGSPSEAYGYNFDTNQQRGTSSSGSDVPWTGVGVGLGGAQYVVITGTLVRATTNTANFVAALERNYDAG